MQGITTHLGKDPPLTQGSRALTEKEGKGGQGPCTHAEHTHSPREGPWLSLLKPAAADAEEEHTMLEGRRLGCCGRAARELQDDGRLLAEPRRLLTRIGGNNRRAGSGGHRDAMGR